MSTPAPIPKNGHLHLPLIRKATLSNFSLYSLRPEISVQFSKGVFCLAGANGLGKSTFLIALNYALTGIVPEPSRAFFSAEEYYKHCQEFTSDFFSGRISEDDRETAFITVEFDSGPNRYTVTREMFNPTDLLDLKIVDIHSGTPTISSKKMSPGEKHSVYSKSLPKDIGLASFEQFVFIQHFLLTFDERRHLLFWNRRELEQILYLAFGVDRREAQRAEQLRREIDKAESRARNHNYQATQLRTQIKDIEKTVDESNAKENQSSDLSEQLKELEAAVEKAVARTNRLSSQLNDANLKLAEATAEQATVKNEYTKQFTKRNKSAPHLRRHPVIATSLREKKCQLCESSQPHVVASIEVRITGKECPLCGSEMTSDTNDAGLIAKLKELDKQLTTLAETVHDVMKRRERLVEELRIVTSECDSAKVRLQQFETENELQIGAMKRKTGGVESLIKEYQSQVDEFLRKKREAYAERDDCKKELKPIQASLQKRYGDVEEVFLPLVKKAATSFLGIDLDVQLESTGSSGIGLTLELAGSRRRQIHQLSESQRYFVDIALRMALVQFMSAKGEPGTLYIDTPEGSLDIAYETTAGRMFAEFVRSGFRIVMTSNINSSQILFSLAKECGATFMKLERMTSWTELSDVQVREEKLFEKAYSNIEKALKSTE